MLGRPFNTKSCFWRLEAEMGFRFPACQSPGIHGTSRCPARPEEAVGECCAGQPANTTVLCTTITFLAFGSSFFFFFSPPLMRYCECITLLSSKEEKRNWEVNPDITFSGLFPEWSYHCFSCSWWGCLVKTFPWVPWSSLISACLDSWWP